MLTGQRSVSRNISQAQVKKLTHGPRVTMKLEELLREKDISPRWLAEAAGLTVNTVYRMQ